MDLNRPPHTHCVHLALLLCATFLPTRSTELNAAEKSSTPQNSAAQRTDDARRFVLIDTVTNTRLENWELESQQLENSGPLPWTVRKRTLHGGKQEGVELIEIDTRELVIRVIPTRGLSIYDVRHKDVRLGWNSPVKDIVHPQYVRLDSRGGLGWLEGFNEWMVRCGLEFAGHPGLDTFTTNTGDQAQMDLTLHGKIGNIPASHVELLVDATPPHRIRLRGTVHERCFFGPKLELSTELSVVPGETTFRLVDTVTNFGSAEQEFQLIYHANYGAPLLEAGSRVIAAINRIEPMTAKAGESIDDYARYAGPTAGLVEQVYLIHPYANAEGQSQVMLQNAAGDRATSIRWAIAELPYLTIWKNMAAVEDGYVTGLEPATGFPYNRSVERKAGRLPKLAPGESRKFELEFGIHVGRDQVQQVAQRIAEIQGQRAPEIRRTPSQTPAKE